MSSWLFPSIHIKCVMIHRHPPDQCMRLDGQCHLPEHHIWVMMSTVVKSYDTVSCLNTINKWIKYLPQRFVNILQPRKKFNS